MRLTETIGSTTYTAQYRQWGFLEPRRHWVGRIVTDADMGMDSNVVARTWWPRRTPQAVERWAGRKLGAMKASHRRRRWFDFDDGGS